MEPQGDRTLEHRQISDTTSSAVFDPLAAPLAPGTNEVSVSALEMQLQPVGPNDLVGHTEFWQFEQGIDTLKIHASGSSCWGIGLSSILRGIRRRSIFTLISCYVNFQEKKKTSPQRGTTHRFLFFLFFTESSVRTSPSEGKLLG
jgi:hypothetical protein